VPTLTVEVIGCMIHLVSVEAYLLFHGTWLSDFVVHG
jgi:hypothetical protein